MVGDGGKQFFFVFAIERRLSNEHFVQQHPVCPPIHGFAIGLVKDDLQWVEIREEIR